MAEATSMYAEIREIKNVSAIVDVLNELGVNART